MAAEASDDEDETGRAETPVAETAPRPSDSGNQIGEQEIELMAVTIHTAAADKANECKHGFPKTSHLTAEAAVLLPSCLTSVFNLRR